MSCHYCNTVTYSIAYGLIAGIFAFVVMEGAFWILSFVGLKVPYDAEEETEVAGGEPEKVGKEEDAGVEKAISEAEDDAATDEKAPSDDAAAPEEKA